jgi:2-methylisocitrate lyase-like PEP mutase family enzyme
MTAWGKRKNVAAGLSLRRPGWKAWATKGSSRGWGIPEKLWQRRRITREVQGPNLANLITGGKTPRLSAPELQERGYAGVAYATAFTYVSARAVTHFFQGLARTGASADFQEHMMHFQEFNNLVGLPGIRDKEKKYYQDVKYMSKV